MGATVQWNNYLYANGAMVGVLYERNPGGVFTRYFLKDHLGSIAVITDEAGAVLERLSYDAWGCKRTTVLRTVVRAQARRAAAAVPERR